MQKKRCLDLLNPKSCRIFATAIAKVAQLVEHNLAKVRVAGSSPVFRSHYVSDASIKPKWRNW